MKKYTSLLFKCKDEYNLAKLLKRKKDSLTNEINL